MVGFMNVNEVGQGVCMSVTLLDLNLEDALHLVKGFLNAKIHSGSWVQWVLLDQLFPHTDRTLFEIFIFCPKIQL